MSVPAPLTCFLVNIFLFRQWLGRLWLWYMHLQTVPCVCYWGVHSWRSERYFHQPLSLVQSTYSFHFSRWCQHCCLLLERRSCTRWSDQVCISVCFTSGSWRSVILFIWHIVTWHQCIFAHFIPSFCCMFRWLTRYLVYNLHKHGCNSANKYFKSTKLLAGMKDMRFQVLMLDVLLWLGIKKVNRMVLMSDMFPWWHSFFPWKYWDCVWKEIWCYSEEQDSHFDAIWYPWYVYLTLGPSFCVTEQMLYLLRSLDPSRFMCRDWYQDHCRVFLKWETSDGGGFGEHGWEDLEEDGALRHECIEGFFSIVLSHGWDCGFCGFHCMIE